MSGWATSSSGPGGLRSPAAAAAPARAEARPGPRFFARGRWILILALGVGACLTVPGWAADDVYQKPSEFIREVFAGELPRADAITLSAADLAEIKRFMPHGYDVRKVRFWAEGDRSVWILNDIGKTQPITVGYVVKGGRIERTKVLIYRESHGYEVRERFFTRQFDEAGLDAAGKLDKRIDNIAGATLSVRALTRMARLALYLEGKRPPK